MEERRTRILIAEDDGVVAKNLSITLVDKGYEVIDVLESGEELLQKLFDTQPNLVIMDINLAGKLDGIETTGRLKALGDVPVLYLTADRDKATLERAKLTNPDGYLIKPFDIDELVSAIEIALYRHQGGVLQRREEAVIHSDHLFVRVKNRLEKVKFESILFVEANDIYSILVTSSQKYILSYSLKTLEEKMPVDQLMRVHRSFIVNLKHIAAIEDNYVIIENQNIPIGKTYREDLMKKLSII